MISFFKFQFLKAILILLPNVFFQLMHSQHMRRKVLIFTINENDLLHSSQKLDKQEKVFFCFVVCQIYRRKKSYQFRFFTNIYSTIKYYTAALKELRLFHVYISADKSQSFHTVFEVKSSSFYTN